MATSSPPGVSSPQEGTLQLSKLIKRKLTDRQGDAVGRLSDVIVRLREDGYPVVTGLVAAIEGRKVFLPAGQVAALDREVLRLGRTRVDLRWFERRKGEVLLGADILGHEVIDVETAQAVRAADLLLIQRDGEWVVSGVNIRRKKRWKPGSADKPESGTEQGGPEGRTFRDWSMIDPQLGST